MFLSPNAVPKNIKSSSTRKPDWTLDRITKTDQAQDTTAMTTLDGKTTRTTTFLAGMRTRTMKKTRFPFQDPRPASV